MSSKSYSAGERGGGTGKTGRMRAAILNQLSTWWNQAKWENEEKADRIFDKMQMQPEKYISPNPDADYQEEAKRIYEKIKEDYSLRTKGDLADINRDYRERAERHLEQQKEKYDEPTNKIESDESGRAPEKSRFIVDESEPESDESEPEPEQEQLEAIESGRADERADESESEHTPTHADERAPADMFLPELLARVAYHALRPAVAGGVSLLWGLLITAGPILARSGARAVRTGAYWTGRFVGFAVRATFAAVAVAFAAVLAALAGVSDGISG